MNQKISQQTEPIIVALDGTAQSIAVLETAATMAGLMGAEIVGIYVEDRNLRRLCDLPFSVEVGGYSATARALSQHCIRREFRAVEDEMRQLVERIANRMQVSWSFETVQGGVVEELVQASQNAAIFGLGRRGHSYRRNLGSTARVVLQRSTQPVLFPSLRRRSLPLQQQSITAVYTGSKASDRALDIAGNLAEKGGSDLYVLIWDHGKIDPLSTTQSSTGLAEQVQKRITFLQTQARILEEAVTTRLLQILQSTTSGVVVVPEESTIRYAELLDITPTPVLVVS
ncbi:universal stress protein [Chloroflexi bacterium TSY]|nr:universal stress protein [Chloroflexi bacterium TSY]